MNVVPIPNLFGRLLLAIIVGVIAWRHVDASPCTMPPPTTLIAQAERQPTLEEQLRDLTYPSTPQAHVMKTRNSDRTDQWVGLQWDSSSRGVLFLLDCLGHVLDVAGVGAVETIQEGPTLSAEGQTVLVTAIATTGTGYKREQVDLLSGAGGKIHLLWSHTKDEHMFMLPKENGEEDVYGWLFEQAGMVIRVYGTRSTFPPPMKDRSRSAPPLSVEPLPAERYCWWHTAHYEACNLVPPAAPPANARVEVIPFVGCSTDEQGFPRTPTGQPLHVAVEPEVADKLAYYKGTQGWGAFAPRGWHCYASYGSAGATLVVTPGEIQPSIIPQNIQGPAVVASSSDGETSGRERVVAVAKRFFPEIMRSYIQRVESYDHSIDWPPIAPVPFAPDAVHRVTDRMVDFVTPANRDGYGTQEMILTPSSQSIRGVISIDEGGLLEVLVRLPAKDDTLSSAILRVEESCLQREDGCLANED